MGFPSLEGGQQVREDCQTKAMRLQAEKAFNIRSPILHRTATMANLKMSNMI